MPMHIGQPALNPVVVVAQRVWSIPSRCGAVEVVTVGGVQRGLEAEFVALAVGAAAAGHSGGEGAWVVVAAFAGLVSDFSATSPSQHLAHSQHRPKTTSAQGNLLLSWYGNATISAICGLF